MSSAGLVTIVRSILSTVSIFQSCVLNTLITYPILLTCTQSFEAITIAGEPIVMEEE